MATHGLHFRCWSCGKQHDVRALASCSNGLVKLPGCCFDALAEVASEFGKSVFHQLPFHLGRLKARHDSFCDKAANEAVTSTNLEIRRAAQEWRNRRAGEKS